MTASETTLGPGRPHDRRARASTGRMTDDRSPDEETGKEKMFSPLTAGVLLFDQSANAFHILSKEAYGFGSVAIEPGYQVGINDGNCSFTAILTTSRTTSTPAARVRSLPVTADTRTRNSLLKSRKRLPRAHAKPMQPCVAFPCVNAVEVRHQATQQKVEGLRTSGSLLDVSRYLPEQFVDQGGHVGGRGLVRGDCTHERVMQGEVPAANSRGRFETSGTTAIAAHQHFRHCCLNRPSQLLCPLSLIHI